ncbi:hypothetical protein F4678DRAFT_465002 [Xylaria arbuscula]|nr:hypothetical protein F4678DRAFT_465002 [Xylaria arbuscula]
MSSDEDRTSYATTLRSMIAEGSGPYTIYYYAVTNDVLPELHSQSWLSSGLASLANFTRDLLPGAPYVCVMKTMERDPLYWETTQLAARIISATGGPSNPEELSSVVVARNSTAATVPTDDFEEHWTTLVRSVAARIKYLAKGTVEIEDWDDPESCLRAIESATELSDQFQPAQPVLYVDGIDRAYDRSVAYCPCQQEQADGGLPEARQDDWDQLAKVQRMVGALLQLFEGKGKLVFVVGQNFEYLDFADAERFTDIPVFLV